MVLIIIYILYTQLYITFDLSDPTIAIVKINLCISDLRTWMIKHKLKEECSVFKKKIIMDGNDALSEYNEIQLGHNRTNGAVYPKIYFKVEICSAH